MVCFQEAGFLTALLTIGLIFWLKATTHEPKNVGKRIGMLAGIGLLTGEYRFEHNEMSL